MAQFSLYNGHQKNARNSQCLNAETRTVEDVERPDLLNGHDCAVSPDSPIIMRHDVNNINQNGKNKCLSNDSQSSLDLSARKTNGAVLLSEALETIPLAYSPKTRQLHYINSNDFKPPTKTDLHKREVSISNLDNLEEIDLKSHCDNETISWSNVENSLSTSATNTGLLSALENDSSLLTNDDQSSHNLLDCGDSCSISGCSIASDDQGDSKPKHKTLTSFFKRGVFSWKSEKDGDEASINSNDDSSLWKIFGRKPSKTVTSFEWANVDSISLASNSSVSTQNSPNVAQGSRSHENIVASSSALIQLDRPANLPAKSPSEQLKHKLEYEQMIQAAKKKELKEAKDRKRQLEAQLKAEDELASATRFWTQEILPNWNQMCNTKKAQQLWWQGIPPCIRGRVWCLAIGNQLGITHQMYDIYAEKAQEKLKTANDRCNMNPLSRCDHESSVELITLDISRTFPHLCIFQEGGPYYKMLFSLLGAYVCYRPDLGYAQGMSFIAAVLILNMDAADAFICFANLLNRPCHTAFFQLDQLVMQAYYSAYNDLLSENLPKLHEHFINIGLSADFYLLDWVYTVFSKAMSLDLASRIWDVFLRDGEEFLFRTALGILHTSQDTLLTMDFITGAKYLTKLPDDFSADKLFKSISMMRMNIGKQSFNDILENYLPSNSSSSDML
ncbi:unnamed protein product [Bemisia tabaci]|uniref:Rab-GAP TBC domain-containing protein n=1 Tax=Bemisia tabaci TaxID=7038 RepID=A0A9P0F8H0_BEMTA|nr:unnamed protein product [Bemisia tabaci]